MNAARVGKLAWEGDVASEVEIRCVSRGVEAFDLVERGEQVIVGVNKYAMTDEPSEVQILVIDESVRTHQLERLEQTRTRRDAGAVANTLEKLKTAARKNENTMPATIEAVRAYATLGEICSALRDVYGIYEEPAF